MGSAAALARDAELTRIYRAVSWSEKGSRVGQGCRADQDRAVSWL